MKKKDWLYEMLKYFAWCIELEEDPKSCSSHAHYIEFVEQSNRHCGDCTKVPCTCSRCVMNHIEIMAQNFLDLLFDKPYGWCDKVCVADCDYQSNEGEST